MNDSRYVSDTELAKKLAELPLRDGAPEAARVRVLDFTANYSSAYPIVIELPEEDCADNVTLSYSQKLRIIPKIDDWRDHLRRWVGLGPYKYILPLTLAFAAASYHLVVRSNDRSYMFSQSMADPDSGRRVTVKEICATRVKDDTPYLRLRHRTAMPFSHLYARGLRGVTTQALNVVVRFHERPPGALGSVVVIATALCGFVIPLAWLLSTHITVPTDIPALLLALPGISAVMLGQNLGGEILSTTSITTRGGLLMTLVISGLATIAYLAQAEGKLKYPGAHLSLFGWTIPITDYLWLVICAITLMVVIWLASSLVIRMRTYQNIHIGSRSSDIREISALLATSD